MCKLCKGKNPKCKCRNKFIGNKKGADPHREKDGKISNQKGVYGNCHRQPSGINSKEWKKQCAERKTKQL